MRQTAVVLLLALTALVGCQPTSGPGEPAAPAEPGPGTQTTEPTAPAPPAVTPPAAPAPAVPAVPVKPAAKVEGDVLVNGHFDKGGDWWVANPKSLKVVRDTESVVKNSAASARIEVAASDTPFHVTQWVENAKPGQAYELTGSFRTEMLEGDLLIQLSTSSSADPANRTFVNFGPVTGTQGWTDFALRTTVPDDADTLAVIVTSRPDAPAQGTIWVDEFALVEAKGEPKEPQNLVKNGGFEEGPLYFWDNPGELVVEADREVKARKGNQSLRVDLTGKGEEDAYLQQWVTEFTPGDTYEVKGWLCTENLPGDVFLQVLTVQGEDDDAEKTVKTSGRVRATTDWREVKATVETTEDTSTLAIQVYYAPAEGIDGVDPDGDITVWVDEVTLEPVSE